MRFAYADPPYLGRADFYRAHHPEAMIWDDPETHRALIVRLQDEYPDGWAMSLSSDSLRVLLPMCPPTARIGTWITDRPRFAGNTNPVSRHCEPVIWCGGRNFAETGTRAADWIITKQVPLAPDQPRYLMQREKARKGELFLGRKPRSQADAHPIIHGKLFEQGAVLLRKQIVDAHADLLKTERILDLEDQLRSVTLQYNKVKDELERQRSGAF